VREREREVEREGETMPDVISVYNTCMAVAVNCIKGLREEIAVHSDGVTQEVILLQQLLPVICI